VAVGAVAGTRHVAPGAGRKGSTPASVGLTGAGTGSRGPPRATHLDLIVDLSLSLGEDAEVAEGLRAGGPRGGAGVRPGHGARVSEDIGVTVRARIARERPPAVGTRAGRC